MEENDVSREGKKEVREKRSEERKRKRRLERGGGRGRK